MGKVTIDEETLDGIGSAIISKGGATAAMTPAQMPSAIQKIPSGWQPPSEWPDIREILRTNKGSFPYGAAFLFDAEGFDSISLSGAEKYIVSDGAVYASNTTHVFDHGRDLPGGFVWVLFLFSTDELILTSEMVHYLNTIWVYAPGITIESVASSWDGIYNGATRLVSFEAKKCLNTGTNSYSDFYHTYSLENFDVDEVQFCDGYSYNGFRETGVRSLRCKIYCKNDDGVVGMICGGGNQMIKIAHVNFGKQSTPDVWYRADVKFLPDTMIMMKLTEGGAIDSRLSALATPRVLSINKSFSIGNTTYLAAYKKRFAEFDTNGNLVDGLAYNMNEVDTSLGLTATISATIKGFFTAPNDPADGTSEQEKIEAAFNAKGWTLAW